MLVSTIAGGVVQALSGLVNNPMSIINVLSENLPKASTFFITYVMLQSLSSTSQGLAMFVPFLLSYVFPMLSSTPRDIYTQKSTCPNINLGTLVPTHTVIFVLGLEYSVVAPLILPFVCLFFFLSYFVYLYQFLYVYEMTYESGGLAFPRAIRHVYIGMFTWQLTMIGLFAVRGNAIGQLVLMIITLVVSCFALALYDKAFKALFKYLPVQEDETARDEKVAMDDKIFIDVDQKKKDDDKRMLTQPDDEEEVSQTSALADNKDNAYRRKVAGFSATPDQLPRQNESIDAYEARQELRRKVLALMNGHSQAGASNDEVVVEDPQAGPHAQLMFEIVSYMHPSLYVGQSTVWLPEDDLGITRAEMEKLKKEGIRTSSENAVIEHAGKRGQKGKVLINEEKVINEQEGIPGDLLTPQKTSNVQDFVRVATDNYNFIEAMAITY